MYEENGLTDDTIPEKMWTIYDAMAQCYSKLGDQHKEIDFYNKAIDLLTKQTTAPEVGYKLQFNSVCFYII